MGALTQARSMKEDRQMLWVGWVGGFGIKAPPLAFTRPWFPLVCPRLLWPSLTRNVTVCSSLPTPQMKIVKQTPLLLDLQSNRRKLVWSI